MALRRLPRKPNVLAVDDKRANLLALDAMLHEDYRMLFATSGRDAISLLEQQPDAADLILMDVQMPEMDGFEAAAEIKKIAGCGDIPIIFITAVFIEDPFVKKGYEAGGIDYFSKPFDPDILRMKLAIYASYKLNDELLKAREKSVRESEELLRVARKLSLLLEGLPIGVIIADAQGRICQTTEEVTGILGCQAPAQNDSYGEMLGWWDAAGHMIKSESGPLAKAIHEGETSPRRQDQDGPHLRVAPEGPCGENRRRRRIDPGSHGVEESHRGRAREARREADLARRRDRGVDRRLKRAAPDSPRRLFRARAARNAACFEGRVYETRGFLYRDTLREAARAIGGVQRLALRLGTSPDAIHQWLAGVGQPPLEIFLQALDVISEGPFASTSPHEHRPHL